VYYTGKGDDGKSSLGGPREDKDDPLFELVGDLDELNSQLGVAASILKDQDVLAGITRIQNDLFLIGSMIYFEARGEHRSMDEERRRWIETEIGRMSSLVPPLNSFVLPGGSPQAAQLHYARAVARRAERRMVSVSKRLQLDQELVRYLNRLSSYLFVAALLENARAGINEKHPSYRAAFLTHILIHSPLKSHSSQCQPEGTSPFTIDVLLALTDSASSLISEETACPSSSPHARTRST